MLGIIFQIFLRRGIAGERWLISLSQPKKNNFASRGQLRLSMQRYEYQDAIKHLTLAIKLTSAVDHHPQALKELCQALVRIYKVN